MKKLFSIVGLVTTLYANLIQADTEFITLQSTTSTANSGLYDAILPVFQDHSGIRVDVVPVGTGQAIKNARNGDGDVLLVHAREAEIEFIEQGYGVERFDVMYNDFILIGPSDDPANISDADSAILALTRIFNSESVFVSRGDDSGTHKKETTLWHKANLDIQSQSGKWYRETGSGMGATLNAAIGMGAYTLTDRGTWISFSNKQDHIVLYEEDESLFNQYGVMLVSPHKHTHVKAKAGQAFIDWILGDQGQNAIAGYQLNGQQLFFPNAKRD